MIIIITAFCLANDGHLLFSAQWLQKPLGGSWWEVLTRGWLIYWASSSPSSPNTELALGFACFHPSVSFSSSLYPSLLSLAFFSLDSMSTPLSPLIYTFTFYPPLLFSLLHFILFIQGHLCMEAVVALGKDNDRGMNELKPKKVLHRSVWSVIDTQLVEAIKEL